MSIKELQQLIRMAEIDGKRERAFVTVMSGKCKALGNVRELAKLRTAHRPTTFVCDAAKKTAMATRIIYAMDRTSAEPEEA